MKPRRILLSAAVACGFLLACAVAIAVAVTRSNASGIIVYNESGVPIRTLSVTAGSQRFALSSLQDQESVRLRLQLRGGGPVALRISGDRDWEWHGPELPATGGYILIVHIRRGLEVEEQMQIAFWQQTIARFQELY